jgi:putative glutamine amidotransferase
LTRQTQPTIGVLCFNLSEAMSPGVPRCGQNLSYIRCVFEAGGVPVLLPQTDDPAALRALFERVDGLLLPGGGDIHPARYGEGVLPACGTIDLLRDDVELTLASWAVVERKPLLAICRGIQVLNVALGGSLYQDISAQLPDAGRHDWYPSHPRDRLSHEVRLVADTRLAQIVGEPRIRVNSLHHQAAKAVAPGLQVSARSPDEIVEGLEVPGHPFALAVQWHPEELASTQPPARALFRAFIQAAGSA